MKKDKAWLKEEVNEIKKLISDAWGAAIIAGNRHFEIKNSSEMQIVKRISDLIDQLDEPQKPVIPQFVADYIEKWKYEGLAMHEWFTFDYDDEEDDEVSKWLYDNTAEENTRREYLLIDAIRYGYEVEKEKLYRIKFSDNQYASRFNGEKISSTLTGEELAAQYTEAEIKAIDKRYWVFAEEVTE